MSSAMTDPCGCGPLPAVAAASSAASMPGVATDRTRAALIGLVIFSGGLCFWGLGRGPALGDHEAIIAVGARSILETGEWLAPRVGSETFIRKTPLPFWMVAAASRFLDDPEAAQVSPTAARAPSALAGVLTVLVIFALARSMFGARTAWITGMALASSAGLLFFAHNAQAEMLLTLLSTCTAACFWFALEECGRRWLWWLLSCLCMALAMLAKAPLPLLTVAAPLAVWHFLVAPLTAEDLPTGGLRTLGGKLPAMLRAQWRRLGGLRLMAGAALFLLVFLPWPIYIWMAHPSAAALWRIEYLDRYTGSLSARRHDWYYYLPVAFGLALPFSLLLPGAVASAFLKTCREQRRGVLFALTWFVTALVLLSTSAFKRPHYLISLLPAVALLLGPTIERFFFQRRAASRRAWLLSAGVYAALVGGVVWGARQSALAFPGTSGTFAVAAAVILVGGLGGLTALCLGQGATAFITIIATATVSFAWSWDSLGLTGAMDRRLDAMISQLRAASIKPTDCLVWITGRPDARLLYYLRLDVQPLFDVLEAAGMREGRDRISEDVMQEGLRRVRAGLEGAERKYYVVEGEYWDSMQRALNLPTRLLFRVPSDSGDPTDDWVVFTNAWNVGPPSS